MNLTQPWTRVKNKHSFTSSAASTFLYRWMKLYYTDEEIRLSHFWIWQQCSWHFESVSDQSRERGGIKRVSCQAPTAHFCWLIERVFELMLSCLSCPICIWSTRSFHRERPLGLSGRPCGLFKALQVTHRLGLPFIVWTQTATVALRPPDCSFSTFDSIYDKLLLRFC